MKWLFSGVHATKTATKELKEEILPEDDSKSKGGLFHKKKQPETNIGECPCLNNCLKYTFFILVEIFGIIMSLFGGAYGGGKSRRDLAIFYSLYIIGQAMDIFCSLFVSSLKVQRDMIRAEKTQWIIISIFAVSFLLCLILGGAVKTVWASIPFCFISVSALVFRNLLFFDVFKSCFANIKKSREMKKTMHGMENKRQHTEQRPEGFDYNLPY